MLRLVKWIMCAGIIVCGSVLSADISTVSAQTTSFRILGNGFVLAGNTVYYLERINFPVGWKALPYIGWTLPPVPPSTLIQYENGVLAITESGEGWGLVSGNWQDLGSVPATPTLRTSWGEVKARYAR